MSDTRIVLVEDDPEVRSRFAQLLGAEPGFSIVGSFGDVESARGFLLRARADVLLVDLGLPDGDGITLIRLCAGLQPACETAVVTVFSDSERVFACLEAGATGYILKDEMPAGLVESVRMLLEGRSPVSPSIARRVLSRFGGGAQAKGASAESRGGAGVGSAGAGRRPAAEGPAAESLSPREIEILELVAKGLSVIEIARLLSLSVHTVGTHVKNIYRKLSVHSRTEALFEARGLGLLRGR
jgi:DNA-binding NarL/FixJ family response regulator